MRTIFKVMAVFLLLFASRLPALCQKVSEKYLDGEIYLKVKDSYPVDINLNSSAIDLRKQLPFLIPFESSYGIEKCKSSFYFARSEKLQRTFRIKFAKKERADELVRALCQLPEVDYAEKIPLCATNHTPDDLGANSVSPGQYSLYVTQAEKAWDIIRGDPSVSVAIVDNAIQANHPDLNAIAGRDVADGDDDPNPPDATFSHGTHCAGIAGARTDNGLNLASIGHGISIMPVKATADGNDPDFVDNGYEGVLWAALNGADVISMSWGGTDGCFTCELAISGAELLGSVLVAAAGNDNMDESFFPAQYDGVIAVANTNIDDVKSGSSNFGTWIDVSAPGSSIQSLVPFNSTGSKSGTSMACPFVAGLIGLAMSARDVYNPGMSNGDVVNCVLSTADNIDGTNPGFVGELGSGRVNAYEALKCCVDCQPVYVEPFATYTGGLVRYRQASKEVHSNVECDNCELTHNSGGFIQLTPSFHIKPGSTYWGHIEGCGPGGSKPKASSDRALPGITKVVESQLFSIAPNPASDHLDLHFALLQDEMVSILLFNQQGQIVRTVYSGNNFEKGSYTERVDVTGLPDGVYFCVLGTTSGKQVKSVMVSNQ